jgi:hypothetical protein
MFLLTVGSTRWTRPLSSHLRCFTCVLSPSLIVDKAWLLSSRELHSSTPVNKPSKAKDKNVIPTSKGSKSPQDESEKGAVTTPQNKKARHSGDKTSTLGYKTHSPQFHSLRHQESSGLPPKVKDATRDDPTYFHGREGLATRWSLPSAKPSEHSAVKSLLRKYLRK